MSKDTKNIGFGQIPNGIHLLLTPNSFAVYTVLAQHPPKFKFRKYEVHKRCFPSCSKGFMDKAWKELKSKGYLEKKYRKINGNNREYCLFNIIPESALDSLNTLFPEQSDSWTFRNLNAQDIERSENWTFTNLDVQESTHYSNTDSKSNTDINNNTHSLPEIKISSKDGNSIESKKENTNLPEQTKKENNKGVPTETAKPAKPRKPSAKQKHGDYLLKFRKAYFNWEMHVPQTSKGQSFANTTSLDKIITALVAENLKAQTGSANQSINLETLGETYYERSLENWQFILSNWKTEGYKGEAGAMGTNTALGLIAKNINKIWRLLNNEHAKKPKITNLQEIDF